MLDTERFIIEIQNRDALRNQSSDDYSNKNLKRQLWLELTDIFGGENLEEKEKGELGLSLQKKWKNIRDTFMRELKRRKGAKSGSAAKRKSAYIYFDQLQFLMPTLEINETSASLSETTPEENDNQTNELTDTPENTRKKTKKNTDSEDCTSRQVDKLTAVLEQSIKARQGDSIQDYDKMFMLSLLSGYKQIPELLKSKAQIELIQVIDKYKCNPQFTGYGFPNTSFEHSQGHTGYYTRPRTENYSQPNPSTLEYSQSIYQRQESQPRPSSSYSTASGDLTFPHSNESEASGFIELFPND
ncbi:uncharacterized protein LOC126974334 [Leptidea sinapis]|uniref:uncharacterized protein LOC126974334 n=1 Tax=Leptidea sinapis TaxID=189913 RepID=UPI0021C3DEB5|nr:uncharacterized protein LOC126974334 [Leptidea sinapis]